MRRSLSLVNRFYRRSRVVHFRSSVQLSRRSQYMYNSDIPTPRIKITLDSLNDQIKEDSAQFMETLSSTEILVEEARRELNGSNYNKCVELSTSALEQIEYIVNSLHLVPSQINIQYVLDIIDKCRYEAYVCRASANTELSMPQEIIDADYENAEKGIP